MSDFTEIQWCDSTVNPIMGCDGCPLFPTPSKVRRELEQYLIARGVEAMTARAIVSLACVDYETTTALVQWRWSIADSIAKLTRWHKRERKALASYINNLVHCYAGVLHLRRGRNLTKPDKVPHKGFAELFEEVKHFPGRMAAMARSRSLLGTKRPKKPWLDGLPRLIFVSDMGDTLSKDVSFDYLLEEIVEVAASLEGRRHLWLWLTKRPARMAQFGRWLERRGIEWPENLVAMTSVLDRKMAKSAVEHLRKVPAKIRALSVEPLLESVTLDLQGIDWVITGGESGGGARQFHLEWARDLQEQCRRVDAAFFVKQLGARPMLDGKSLKLENAHGGDWAEWPDNLKIRQMPDAFAEYGKRVNKAIKD